MDLDKMRIELRPVRLSRIVDEAIGMIRPLVRESDIDLSADLPLDLPRVLVDRARVQQVMLNLLNNARRFTERGRITVTACARGDQVQVTIADTGIGIPPGEHSRVFKEFEQLEGSVQNNQDGTGLGLAISKRFVEMHGGRIWVESDGIPGQGTRVRFTLPVAGPMPSQVSWLSGSPLPLRAPEGRGRAILLVDFEESVVGTLERELESYHIIPVADMSRVPSLLAELHPQAIVVNAARGGQAWRQARTVSRGLSGSQVPVILCPLVGDRQLGRNLGVVEYLLKPVSYRAVIRLLDQLHDHTERVLLIDDDPRMSSVFSRILKGTGRNYTLEYASSGQDGLRAMRERCPDLVLLDLVMPDTNGRTVLAQMRRDPHLRDVPVVIVTGRSRTPEDERLLGGADLHMTVGSGLTNREAIFYLRGILDARLEVLSLPTHIEQVA
jgi:CheY-like chemotaxis protein